MKANVSLMSLRTLLMIVANCLTMLGGTCHVLAKDTNQVPILRMGETAKEKSIEWVWYVDRDALKRQPRWDGYSSAPPFPIHQAVANTMQQIRKSHPSMAKWKIESIRVRPVEDTSGKEKNGWMESVWYYHIQLVPSSQAEYEQWESKGQIAALSRVVLMDGTVLGPTLIAGDR
jgi:hypothetical protein